VVAAGAGGNILNALIRPPLHTSIGASTAVFAAIGLLAALQQRRGRRSDGLHNWAPLAGGVMLLTFLGLSGEQTDVLAHVFGFLAGLGLGSLLAWMDRPWPKDRALQRVCAWTAVATVALAWIWGFLAQS
jgi:membrane associated rhomboid family serine protease